MANENEDTRPHTERAHSRSPNYGYEFQGSQPLFKESFDVEEETAVWKIQLPGIEPERISCYTLGNQLKVKVKDAYKHLVDVTASITLAEGETVSAALILGEFIVNIDRPNKRKPVYFGTVTMQVDPA